eukprot:1148665-Pelagomonas_calceolata.AAC.1
MQRKQQKVRCMPQSLDGSQWPCTGLGSTEQQMFSSRTLKKVVQRPCTGKIVIDAYEVEQIVIGPDRSLKPALSLLALMEVVPALRLHTPVKWKCPLAHKPRPPTCVLQCLAAVAAGMKRAATFKCSEGACPQIAPNNNSFIPRIILTTLTLAGLSSCGSRVEASCKEEQQQQQQPQQESAHPPDPQARGSRHRRGLCRTRLTECYRQGVAGTGGGGGAGRGGCIRSALPSSQTPDPQARSGRLCRTSVEQKPAAAASAHPLNPLANLHETSKAARMLQAKGVWHRRWGCRRSVGGAGEVCLHLQSSSDFKGCQNAAGKGWLAQALGGAGEVCLHLPSSCDFKGCQNAAG